MGLPRLGPLPALRSGLAQPPEEGYSARLHPPLHPPLLEQRRAPLEPARELPTHSERRLPGAPVRSERRPQGPLERSERLLRRWAEVFSAAAQRPADSERPPTLLRLAVAHRHRLSAAVRRLPVVGYSVLLRLLTPLVGLIRTVRHPRRRTALQRHHWRSALQRQHRRSALLPLFPPLVVPVPLVLRLPCRLSEAVPLGEPVRLVPLRPRQRSVLLPRLPDLAALGHSVHPELHWRSARPRPLRRRLWDCLERHQRQGLTLVRFSSQPKPFWSHLHMSPCLIVWVNILQPTHPTNCAHVKPKSRRV